MGSSRIGCFQEQVTGLLQAIPNDLESTQGNMRKIVLPLRWVGETALLTQLYWVTFDKLLTAQASVSSTVAWETQYIFCFVSLCESTLNKAELCARLSSF